MDLAGEMIDAYHCTGTWSKTDEVIGKPTSQSESTPITRFTPDAKGEAEDGLGPGLGTLAYLARPDVGRDVAWPVGEPADEGSRLASA